MATLTSQFRQETYVGCVDRAVQKLVGAFALGAALAPEQWRIASRAVRAADHAISVVALDVLDLLHTSFGVPRGEKPGRGKLSATARYHLILALPQVVHCGRPAEETSESDAELDIFQRLAEEL